LTLSPQTLHTTEPPSATATPPPPPPLMVLYAFPIFMLPVMCLRGCIVFKRDGVKDKEAFNRWIDGKLAASPQAGLMIYPEGVGVWGLGWGWGWGWVCV